MTYSFSHFEREKHGTSPLNNLFSAIGCGYLQPTGHPTPHTHFAIAHLRASPTFALHQNSGS